MGNVNSSVHNEEGSGTLKAKIALRKSGSMVLPPFETVLAKIKDHEQYAELHRNEEYMTRFAQCLSDPQTMRQTYLSLDWAISREWVLLLTTR